MNVDVFDTYVTLPDSSQMHFDILVPEGGAQHEALGFAKAWLNEVGIATDSIQLDKCRFCHSQAAHPEIEHSLTSKGYAVLQMEGCPAPIF